MLDHAEPPALDGVSLLVPPGMPSRSTFMLRYPFRSRNFQATLAW